MTDDRWLSVDEIAEHIGVTKDSIYRWIERKSLPAHKVIGIVGPNGAGKTTLLQLAAGLRYPTRGSIMVLDRSPRANAGDLLPRVGFIGQDRPLYGDLTVRETLELGRDVTLQLVTDCGHIHRPEQL